jgi:hypothetical protein
MPFQSQFSLSLELTKLIPMGSAAAGKTYEAAMSLARDLQVRLNFCISKFSLIKLYCVNEMEICRFSNNFRLLDQISSSKKILPSFLGVHALPGKWLQLFAPSSQKQSPHKNFAKEYPCVMVQDRLLSELLHKTRISPWCYNVR